MARVSEPPDLGVRKSLLRFVVEAILKGIILIWLYAQAFGFGFYMIWHYSNVSFREFMFRDYINLWDIYSRDIFPPWFFEIPTWKDPLPWVIIALLLIAYIRGNRGFPSLNFSVPRYGRRRSGDPYKKPNGQKSDSHTDDDFAFDPSAFGEPSPNDSQEVKTLKLKLEKMARDMRAAEQRAHQAEQTTSHGGSKMTLQSALDLFEMSPPYTAEALKKRRMDLLKKVHPDTGGSNMIAKMVNEAYDLLKE